MPPVMRQPARWVALLCLCLVFPARYLSADDGYWIYVAAESDDQVFLVRFAPAGFSVEKIVDVGVRPTDIEGPHGVRVSPDGDYWYVSLAHGNPFGSVHKFHTGTDAWEAAAEVGMFPATMDVASSTGLLYVANFDLHGDMNPGSISIVDTQEMAEVARVGVGVMPHGSRLNAAGDRQYSVMMMSDELIEVDAGTFTVNRRLSLVEGSASASPPSVAMGRVKPTWVELAPDGQHAYVALNGANEIVEIDLNLWEVSRRFAAGPGPYNLALSEDGKWLVATYRPDGSTGVWDVQTGQERARIPNSRPLSHGVVVSPDSRYAFVSVEGVRGEPGGVDVIDLNTLERVASLDVGKQASGIAFWKIGE